MKQWVWELVREKYSYIIQQFVFIFWSIEWSGAAQTVLYSLETFFFRIEREKRDMITLMLPCKDIFNFQMFFTHHKAGKYEQIKKCKSCILFCKVDIYKNYRISSSEKANGIYFSCNIDIFVCDIFWGVTNKRTNIRKWT